MADDTILVLNINRVKSDQPPSQTENYPQTAKPPPTKTKAVVEKHPPPTIMKATKNLSRAKWEKVKHKKRINKAIEIWEGGGDNVIDSNGEWVSLSEVLNIVGIPYNTMRKNIKGDKEN